MFIIQPPLGKRENDLKTFPHGHLLHDIEAISGLAVLLEEKDLLQNKHLIVSTNKNLEKLRAFFHFKKPKVPWFVLPSFPITKSFYSDSLGKKRLKWQSWAGCEKMTSGLFLASPQALLKKTNVSLTVHIIEKGAILNPTLLKSYKETAFVERMGEFSSRVFLMDIFSPAYETPLRIQLAGTTVQSIHLLDREFKRRKQELKYALISPLYEWSFSGMERKNLCAYLKQQENVLSYNLPQEFFKNVSLGQCPKGFEYLLNCLNKTCSLDFFHEKPCLWLFDPERAKDEFLEEKSKLEGEHPFFTEANLFLPWEKIGNSINDSSYICREKQTEKKITVSLQDKPTNTEGINVQQNALSLLSEDKEDSFCDKAPEVFFSLLKDFSAFIFKKSNNLREDFKNLPVENIVFTGPKVEEFKRHLLKEKILSSHMDFFEGKSLIFLSSPIAESFSCKGNTAYLRTEDLMPKKQSHFSHFDFFRLKAKALEFSQLEVGDLLVHKQYGIGEFVGLQSLNVLGKNREDFIVLNYKDGDKLFVPAYKASQVKRYSRKRSDQMTKTLLDRLGNPKSWERKKSQAKKHIQSLAIELIEIYRSRKQKKRPPFAPVKERLVHFAKGFPWTETLDQTRAIQEIMMDMDKEQPMDRLLTADTGFGKTEVALRACFRALANGFQVCLLAPTTVLTLQHFKNLKQRFKNTPFRLALLNRFISNKEKESLFQQVGQGLVDFLIATHSVLNPRLAFKNLGLLVLDEEHRFGVSQKERLSRFKKDLDILSLSATPIPRTLNMALSGIKDISVISRPPAQRKPVKIILKSWGEGAEESIVQACKQEKARGGQILFVHNRVRTLNQRAEHLRRILPDFNLGVAKGQMDDLEQVILDFFEQKYDILLSTNIIESGMDIPQANTLFIDRVHEMGLSQIYQLKGRVGRSMEQAFCYLLFPERSRLSVLARERLELLKKYSGLGNAFQLALHDLDHRGAGSLFGSEQSGHLQKIGEDLYFEMLNEQIQDQKEIFIEPEITLPFVSGIPPLYIPEPRLRLLYYKSLSEASNKEAREKIQFELLKEFGPCPKELDHLFFLLDVRETCKKLLIRDLKVSKQTISLIFHEKTSVTSEKILKILKARKGKMTAEMSCKIPLQSEELTTEIKQLLQELYSS